MTSAQSVFDFVKTLPKFMAHEDMYMQKMREANLIGDKVPINMVDFEAASIGWLEQNILSSVKYDYQFIQQNFAEKHIVRFDMLAKQNDCKDSLSTIKHDSELEMSFMTNKKKKLSPNASCVAYPSGDSANPVLDNALIGKIRSACTNLNATNSNDMAMTGYTERLTVPTDMRHMLLKGYLYLQDFNLAITSGYGKASVANITSRQVKVDDALSKLNTLLNYDVVVDSNNFTTSEVAFLNLMGNAYPKIKYAKSNVYNSVMLKADKLAIISDKDYQMPNSNKFKSPSDMCVLLYTIAMKLGVLGQLREVIKGFRGVPHLLDDIATTTGVEHYTLEYGTSKCYRGLIARTNEWKEDIEVMSNYYGSSISLVADGLVAEGLKYNVLSLLEDLNALGAAGLPTGVAHTDPIFQCLLRDHGLKHEADDVNTLKGTWTMNRNSGLPFSTSGIIKDYVTEKLAKLIEQKMDGKGLFYGPMGYLIPATNQLNSTWSEMSGWSPIDVIPVKNPIKESQHRAAFAHMIGMTTNVPITGNNALGTVASKPKVKYDYKLERLTGGHYRIVNLHISPANDLDGRIDSIEFTGGSLLDVHYKGTIGRVVMTDQGTIELLDNIHYNEIKTTFGDKSDQIQNNNDEEDSDEEVDDNEEYIQPMTVGGSKVPIRHGMEPTSLKKNPFCVVTKKPNKLPLANSKYVEPVVVSEPEVGEIEIEDESTQGDGTCGIHAVAQDLVNHGFINKNAYSRVRERMIEESADKTWQSIEDLALLVNNLGMGLSVIHKENNRWKCLNYGTDNTIHNVRIKLENGHYTNWRTKHGTGNTIEIVKSEKGQKPEEIKELLEVNRKWFKQQ